MEKQEGKTQIAEDGRGCGERSGVENKRSGREEETKGARKILKGMPTTTQCLVPQNLVRGADGIGNRMAAFPPLVIPFLS